MWNKQTIKKSVFTVKFQALICAFDTYLRNQTHWKVSHKCIRYQISTKRSIEFLEDQPDELNEWMHRFCVYWLRAMWGKWELSIGWCCPDLINTGLGSVKSIKRDWWTNAPPFCTLSIWLKILIATKKYDTKQTVPTLNLLIYESPLKTTMQLWTHPNCWSHKSFSSSWLNCVF